MEKAMEELQTAMAAMQLTIIQQRGVIDQQRDAIRRLQERGTGIEANNNKMATDAEEEDRGIPTSNMGSTAINTTTPKIFQLTAKTRTPPRASIVAAARGLEEHHEEELESVSENDEEEEDTASAISAAATNNGDRTKPLGYVGLSKKIDRISRIIKKWGKVLEGREQRTLTKCTQVVQQQQAQLIQLQTEQALERALSPEKLQPLLDRGPYGELEEQALLSDEAARKIIVYPLPKNTDPERDEGRRAARAVALARQHQQDEGAVYADAARYPRRRNAFVAVVV
ncbi:hypothetical protein HPB52_022459 [Rhipicephalus sanguineus]|uniref:Uncharacterized protein n=1 Tax=Rhipicephalus sanguineus TaxID=34632 RepID=A0A9D4T220_RHISA|nr:hypothetical protein HPB52_022459 [Rhipicephalus sanguineus]